MSTFSPPGRLEHWPVMHPLFGRLSITRGVSLLKESGVYRQVDGPSAEEIANADITYLGGHVYEIDAGEAEPADWQVSGTDTTAALQQPGAIGLISYLSGSSATPTALLSVDTFRAEGPAVETIALDGFGRSLASGWGSAEVGGAWTHQGGSASFSVSDGQGRIALNISDTRASRLLSVATDDVEILTTVSVDRTGAGYYASVIGRQVGSDMYSARLRFEANGAVRLYMLRNESALTSSFVLPGAGYVPGVPLTVRVRVTGTTPTAVSAKVWRASEVAALTAAGYGNWIVT